MLHAFEEHSPSYGYQNDYYGNHNSSFDHEYHYDATESEALFDADVSVNELDEQMAIDDIEVSDTAGDLADVEAYAGAGPRDLWGGRGGSRCTTKVLAGKISTNMQKHEQCVLERKYLMEQVVRIYACI